MKCAKYFVCLESNKQYYKLQGEKITERKKVLGHFHSATSPIQFSQSQLPQQQFSQPLISPTLTSPQQLPQHQFPHAVNSYPADYRILVFLKELLVSQQLAATREHVCSFLRLSLPEPTYLQNIRVGIC